MRKYVFFFNNSITRCFSRNRNLTEFQCGQTFYNRIEFFPIFLALSKLNAKKNIAKSRIIRTIKLKFALSSLRRKSATLSAVVRLGIACPPRSITAVAGSDNETRYFAGRERETKTGYLAMNYGTFAAHFAAERETYRCGRAKKRSTALIILISMPFVYGRRRSAHSRVQRPILGVDDTNSRYFGAR